MPKDRETPLERFRDAHGREVEVEWPKPTKEPKLEPSERWAFLEDRRNDVP
jgi:hypothetical protein